MPTRPNPNMPNSLLWLSDELYWKQDLSASPKAAVHEEPRPFRTVPVFSTPH